MLMPYTFIACRFDVHDAWHVYISVFLRQHVATQHSKPLNTASLHLVIH